jgi:hypothetical protein
MRYISYEEAKSKIHNLNIKSVKQYYDLFKNKQIPTGIPRNPNRDYQEFINWSDFLGNNNVAAKNKEFYTYLECQNYLVKENINSKEKFEKWRKTNTNKLVPTRPDKTYKSDWVSWGVFLKTNRTSDIQKHNSFLSYTESKEFLKKINFQNENEFYAWAKTEQRPANIPASPRKTYGIEFISMGDFLSNDNFRTKDWILYEDYKSLVQELQLNSKDEFVNWARVNCIGKNIPANPFNVYPEFEGWPEFLGYQRRISVGEKTISSILVTNNIQHKPQYTIPECKDISVLPFDVGVIKNDKLLCLIEYHGIQHFLAVEFYGGEDALQKTQKRDKIKRDFCLQNKIPLLEITYKENLEVKLFEFMNDLGVLLDVTTKRKPALSRNFLPFEKSREIIRDLNLTSLSEFKNLKDKRPFGVPHTPEIVYANNGWISWGDFLGTNRVQSQKIVFVSFEECRQWFIDNNIKSGDHWKKVRKTKPNNIPSNPEKTYKHNWKGWKDFLKIAKPNLHNLHKTP